jgi:perosamine synthetase
MNKRIPLSEPVMAGNEWKYVKECIDTAWVSSLGKFVDMFAEKFAEYLEMPYAVPTVNGTAALHISLVALELKPDEEVLVPTLTFAATANVVVYCNAHPVFIDVEEDTLGIDPQKVEEFLTQECDWKNGCLINKSTNRRVRGIIPVHLYGHPVDMSPILELAGKYGLFIVEDATEALGSKYKGQFVGTFGETGAFSFNGNKIITTGGGGMVATKDADLEERIKFLTTQARQGPEYYHTEIGYNYRLTNIQAALGLAQLEKIDEFIAKRRSIAHYYQKVLKDVPGITVGGEAEWAWNNYWLSWILVEADYGKSKDELLKELNDKRIEARAFFIPLHTLPPYRSYQAYQISKALELYDKGINLPSHTTLEKNVLNFVVDTIKNFAKN